MRQPVSVIRHPRLPVWPAWQGVVLGLLGQVGPLRPIADRLEDAFGGRVCPVSLDAAAADPFILLVHHRHAFRKLDFLRPIFAAAILPEGFPAHPHRGFETVTYVLPGRGGLRHRDSLGCKMRYGDGAVQWMTAGDGMLHEEMWDVESGSDFELYQLWLNLPAARKRIPPRVQLLQPSWRDTAHADGGSDDRSGGGVGASGGVAVVERAGAMPVSTALIACRQLQGGAVVERLLADGRGGSDSDVRIGADINSPVLIAHVEIFSKATSHRIELPDGWTTVVYVRRGRVGFGGADAGDSSTPTEAGTYETAYMSRSGGDLELTSLSGGVCDVLVLAGEPLLEPVAAQGTMVMNSQAEVSEALRDYSMGSFGVPWGHELSDKEWASQCDAYARARGFSKQ